MTILGIAISNLKQRPLKSLFILLSLAIGVGTIIAVYLILETMQTDIASQMTDYGPNILITADTGETTFSYGGIRIPGIKYGAAELTVENAQALEDLRSGAMIRALVPKLLGSATVTGIEVIVAGTDIHREFAIKPWLRTIDYLAKIQKMTQKTTGGSSAGGAAMGGEKLDLNRADHSAITLVKGEVLLGADAAYELNLFPSNRFLINQQEFKVKAVLEKNGTAEDGHILMNLEEAQELFGTPGQLTAIELAADYTLGSEAELLSEISRVLPEAKVTSLLKPMQDRGEITSQLAYFGFAAAAVILLGGMLAAGISMTSSVRERTREIGVFRAIGFRRSFIRKIIFLEGIMLSLAGGLLGSIVGTITAGAAIPMLSDVTVTMPWRVDVLLGGLLLALLIGSAASVYPANQAANLDPAEALRFI